MKHVVITGVSRGLGRAMAVGFADDGWTVSGCGTDTAALQSLADELAPEHHVQPCDVTDPAAVEQFATVVIERFGAAALLLKPLSLSSLKMLSLMGSLLFRRGAVRWRF